jgi:succinylglutamic semialdehyde dehydrogenase
MPQYIDGQWIEGSGGTFASIDPASQQVVFELRSAGTEDVKLALRSARRALADWSMTNLDERVGLIQRFAQQVQHARDALIEAICREAGKPRWEAATEVDAMVNKVAVTIDAHRQRRSPVETTSAGTRSAIRYKPVGVCAVLGPFNFPGHLPNGHIVPAVLCGNTVVFKPSEYTPLVAHRTAECWERAGAPRGVINLVQGARATGSALVADEEIDAVLFTGSYETGRALQRALVDHPEKILALEMGGNNPLVVHDCADIDAACYWTIFSAFLTAGQRCSAARRLIVVDNVESKLFLKRLVEVASSIRVGAWTDVPEPFSGPVISVAAGRAILEAQSALASGGARVLLEMRAATGPAMLRPGILDVTDVRNRSDEEMFGPLLQVIRVPDIDAALLECSRTKYGLSAALFSDDQALWNRFSRTVRAGVVNWNKPTVGATGQLPFGGFGCSGNGRPSGYFAVDYCSHPSASLESPKVELPKQLLPGIDLKPRQGVS